MPAYCELSKSSHSHSDRILLNSKPNRNNEFRQESGTAKVEGLLDEQVWAYRFDFDTDKESNLIYRISDHTIASFEWRGFQCHSKHDTRITQVRSEYSGFLFH